MTVSPLVLGAMMFGTHIDEETSFALLDRFVERGGVWIDTADCYAFWASESGMGGDSEALLGRWLESHPEARDQVKIATKIGEEPLWPGSWPGRKQGLSARSIRAALEGSLDRLGVDSVDLLWLHAEDRAIPIEQVVDSLAGLVDEGVVQRLGASNHPAWRIERARRHALDTGTIPIDAFQLSTTYLRPRPGAAPPGNVHRFGVLEDEQRDYAEQNGVEIWAYTPLLAGAYDNPEKEIPEVFDHPGSRRRLAVLGEVASETGASHGQVVLAWLLAKGIRPILGGSKVHQLDSAMDGAALELTPEQLTRLDAPS